MPSCTNHVVKAKCPACANTAIHVTTQTVLHNLQFPVNMSIDVDEQHFYCTNEVCDVGYFTGTGAMINKTKLRSRDLLKQGWLCYCFGISASAYGTALSSGKAGSIKTFVIQQTRQGSCACELRNPSGRCCLADFNRLEKQHEAI